VSKEVEAAMHPERVYVFYHGEERHDLTLGYSSGGQSHDLRITEESELLRLMPPNPLAQAQRRHRAAKVLMHPNPDDKFGTAEAHWLRMLYFKTQSEAYVASVRRAS